jgi:hypothetical protein
MSDILKNLLNDSSAPEPSARLLPNILSAIAAKEAKAMRNRLFFGIFGAISSLALLIIVGIRTVISLRQSGTVQYLSLLFSDSGAVFAAGSQFILAILESVPATSIALFLLLAVCMVLFIKFLARDAHIKIKFNYGKSY